MKTTLLFLSVFLSVSLFGQLSLSSGSIQDYLENIVGPSVAISNINYSGQPSQIGYFDNIPESSNPLLLFNEGVVISNGPIYQIIHPSGSGSSISGQPASAISDLDLTLLAQTAVTNPNASNINTTTDAAILEFDFIPLSNTIDIEFVFASDEYVTWINTIFNDVMGVFLSGPGIIGTYSSPSAFPNGSINIAVTPDSLQMPITVSTICPATPSGPGVNAGYYIFNSSGTNNQANNGFTVPLNATHEVQCGELYHLKIAIADCMDDYLGSSLFIKESGIYSGNSVGYTSDTICDNSSVTINGQIFDSTGIYSQIIPLSNGCDSMVFYDLTFSNNSLTTFPLNACDSILFGGSYQSMSGTYTEVFVNEFGCDSVVELNLIILNSFETETEANICEDSFYWNDSTYTISGYYIDTLQTIGGCDSIISLNLTINNDDFQLSFSASDQLFTEPPFAVQFTNETLNLANYDFEWDFGDGTVLQSNNLNVFHEYIQNGLYSVSLFAEDISTGCVDSLVESDYIYTTGINNLTELSTSKNLIQILDLMGRETSFKPNAPLIYVYDDGSIEKVFSVEY
ncbi:choice-of-anchor L domain-containing protein [Crocinitomicaceae bacterium]|nr:choice-of-anchor L domain-containing protein [Crocinitomicaceae bacterium]